METSTILYEPLPLGRIGVRLHDEEVVITSDFSTFGYMLEEFISLAATTIAIPSSYPEAKNLELMPPLLRKRIKVIDDSREIETVARLLYSLRSELRIKSDDETGKLICPKELPKDIRFKVRNIHGDVKRLILGFNHNLQVGIKAQTSVDVLRDLRTKVTDSNSRLILSQLEAIFKQYETVTIDMPTPCKKTPAELITIFDRLVNDDCYLELSYVMSELPEPATRTKVLLKIRELARTIMAKSFISNGWDYAAKIIKVTSGVMIPEAKQLGGIFHDQQFPPLIDLSDARERAVKMWFDAPGPKEPLNREGKYVSNGEVIWMPPMETQRASHPDDETLHLGTVRELRELLVTYQQEHHSEEPDSEVNA